MRAASMTPPSDGSAAKCTCNEKFNALSLEFERVTSEMQKLQSMVEQMHSQVIDQSPTGSFSRPNMARRRSSHHVISITTCDDEVRPANNHGNPLAVPGSASPDNRKLSAFLAFDSNTAEERSVSPSLSRRDSSVNEDWATASQAETVDTHATNPRRRKKTMAKESVSHALAAGMSESRQKLGCLDAVQKMHLGPDDLFSITIDALYVLAAAGYVIALAWVFLSPSSELAVSDPVPLNVLIPIIILGVFTIAWTVTRLLMRFKNDYEIIDDPAQIRATYSKSRWFVLDVFLCVPFDFIFVDFYPLLFYICLFRHPILRVIRIVKLSQSADPLAPSNRHWILMLGYFVGALCIAHTSVCIFWRLEGTDSTTGKPLTYIDAMYWVTATMSSTGYGDISARYQSSRMFAVVLMLIGLIIISGTTAIVTAFLSNKDALEEEHDRMRRMMGSMLRHYSLPWEMQKEVVALFPTVLSGSSEQQFRQMIRQLPPFMEQRVDGYLRVKLLRQVPLFASLEQDESQTEALLLLSQRMRTIFVEQNEYVITAGEPGNEMYILMHGSVDVLVPAPKTNSDDEPEEKKVATLRAGSFFGEIALIEDTVRTASVLALQSCELLLLTRVDFNYAVSKSPLLQQALADAVKLRREAMEKQQRDVIGKLQILKQKEAAPPDTSDSKGNTGQQLDSLSPLLRAAAIKAARRVQHAAAAADVKIVDVSEAEEILPSAQS